MIFLFSESMAVPVPLVPSRYLCQTLKFSSVEIKFSSFFSTDDKKNILITSNAMAIATIK